jgi:hypothetical protein
MYALLGARHRTRTQKFKNKTHAHNILNSMEFGKGKCHQMVVDISNVQIIYSPKYSYIIIKIRCFFMSFAWPTVNILSFRHFFEAIPWPKQVTFQ